MDERDKVEYCTLLNKGTFFVEHGPLELAPPSFPLIVPHSFGFICTR